MTGRLVQSPSTVGHGERGGASPHTPTLRLDHLGLGRARSWQPLLAKVQATAHAGLDHISRGQYSKWKRVLERNDDPDVMNENDPLDSIGGKLPLSLGPAPPSSRGGIHLPRKLSLPLVRGPSLPLPYPASGSHCGTGLALVWLSTRPGPSNQGGSNILFHAQHRQTSKINRAHLHVVRVEVKLQGTTLKWTDLDPWGRAQACSGEAHEWNYRVPEEYPRYVGSPVVTSERLSERRLKREAKK